MRARLLLYIGLLGVWIYLAYGFLQRGRTGTGVVFLAIGLGLFVLRLRRLN